MNKKLIFILLFLSHDVLFCMEQTVRTSQEKERQALLVKEISKKICTICTQNIDPENKIRKIIKLNCEHEFHDNCLIGQTIQQTEYANKCSNCRKEFTLPEEILQDYLMLPKESIVGLLKSKNILQKQVTSETLHAASETLIDIPSSENQRSEVRLTTSQGIVLGCLGLFFCAIFFILLIGGFALFLNFIKSNSAIEQWISALGMVIVCSSALPGIFAYFSLVLALYGRRNLR